MADESERSEEATPRKKERLHREGNVPRSADITTAAILLALVPTAAAIGEVLVAEVLAVGDRMFRLEDLGDPFVAIGRLRRALWVIGVPVLVTTVVACAAGVAQARVWTTRPLVPDLARLNPFPNFKKIVPGKDTLIELLKQVVKMGAVGGVVGSIVADATPRFTLLPAASVSVGAMAVAGVVEKLILQAGLAFAVVAVFDYLLAVRKFGEDAKMSKEEVRDERKQENISPEIRQRQRRRMIELGRRAGGPVKDATVVVTNPSHYAVALRYDGLVDDAPRVLAKGVDHVAMEIRSEARRHQIPMVENRPLARALYAKAKVGQAIPLQFYRAVAEVIAFVMQLRASSARGPG